jgi:ABC-type nitrate/sulfonate/bicarbonate transport system permease component
MNWLLAHRIKPWVLNLASIFAVLLLWQGVSALGLVRPIFLPSLSSTLQALWQLLSSGRFFIALGSSFYRIVIATALALVVGSAIGVVMGASKTAENLLSPLTQTLRYLPITALIPLLIVWFGIGNEMKIIFLFLGIVCYFIPLVNNAIRTVPQEYIDVARAFGAKPWAIIRKVYWPHALPQIFNGLIVVNAIGWNYVILAEIINSRNGLGYLINLAGRLQRSNEVFAGLILIAAVAISSDQILRAIQRKKLFW